MFKKFRDIFSNHWHILKNIILIIFFIQGGDILNNIRVGCSVLIKSNNKLLLGIRNKEPNKGMIITPGGGVELFERMEDTVKEK